MKALEHRPLTDSQESEPLITAEGISHVFRQRKGLFRSAQTMQALTDVSLTVKRGTVLGIVGESGSGKSTLARVILGLLKPSAGEVRILGRTLASMHRKDRAKIIQPIFQDPYSSLNPRQRLHQIVSLPLTAQGTMHAEEVRESALDTLEKVGLSRAMAEKFPAQLSGGQRQRVAIARALVLRPEIVVCDEPTSALDVSIQAQILNLLMDLQRDFSLTYLFVSHNLAVVEHLATDAIVMRHGRIVEHGEISSIFSAPRDPYTQVLINSVLTVSPGAGIPNISP